MALTNSIQLPAGAQGSVSTNDFWSTGTSQDARQIQRLENLPIDYTIVKLAVQCTALDGGTGFVRVYQLGRESEAAYLEIPQARMLPYIKDGINLVVSESNGERTIIIDAFDPSNASHNAVTMAGNVFLTAQPYIAGTTNTGTSSG